MNLTDALALRAKGQHVEARDALRELATLNPTDWDVQFEAAYVHDFLGQEGQAVPYCVAAPKM